MQQPDLTSERSTALYENHAPAVLAYLLKQLDSREDAEDVLLEVFTVVLEKESTLRQDERALRAWILTIARNKVADYYRRSGRLPRVPLVQIEESIYEREECEPEQTLLRQEEYQQLQIHVQKLPKIQQEILQLRFGEGLRCREIAQVISKGENAQAVSKSESAVRTLLYRALKQLRSIYEHERAERLSIVNPFEGEF